MLASTYLLVITTRKSEKLEILRHLVIESSIKRNIKGGEFYRTR